MGVIHTHVDERLTHGQVATVWINSLGASRIIVVNDVAPKDEMVIGALKMAKPAGVKLSILSTNIPSKKSKQAIITMTKLLSLRKISMMLRL